MIAKKQRGQLIRCELGVPEVVFMQVAVELEAVENSPT